MVQLLYVTFTVIAILFVFLSLYKIVLSYYNSYLLKACNSVIGGLHPDKADRDEIGESRPSGSGQDGGAYCRDQNPGQVPEEEETGR